MTDTIFNPQDHLPLTPATFHILLALARTDNHGYGIMLDVEAQTDGRVQLGAGTLYGSIKRLLTAGWIIEVEERPDPALDDVRRRYYRLTAQGGRVARAEAERLVALVQLAQEAQLLGRLAG